MDREPCIKNAALFLLIACFICFSGCSTHEPNVSVQILSDKEEPIELPLINKDPFNSQYNVSYIVTNLGHDIESCTVNISMYNAKTGRLVESMTNSYWAIPDNGSLTDYVVFKQTNARKYRFTAEIDQG